MVRLPRPTWLPGRRAAIYARGTARLDVSATKQEMSLRALADDLGLRVVRVFQDTAPSTVGSRESNNALRKLLLVLRSGVIDLVAIWTLPAVGGSPGAVSAFLMSLRDARIELLVHAEDPDDAVASGRALIAAAPHFEALGKAERRQRTLVSQAQATSAGRHIGRPPISSEKAERVIAALNEGAGVRAAGRRAGVSAASASRIARWACRSTR
ncbi:recombinase family protein [Roseomonas eburnea]|uniref:Recombinase family protein n=2 Tax=Neoroseomonas eburnea TaxID=1346889 RepID=A0A9X9XKE0_9PROT|nr:recombinase family protein [Neoroseomonas eburnea]MBR0684176.1 recombinase family protein [Neoroseomonas eburnea]